MSGCSVVIGGLTEHDRRLLHEANANIPEPGGGRPVAGVAHLLRLSLAAVGCAPDEPVVPVADGVATAPEGRGHSGVGSVFQQRHLFALLDIPGYLGAELKVQSPVVDAPAPVGLHVDAVICIGY